MWLFFGTRTPGSDRENLGAKSTQKNSELWYASEGSYEVAAGTWGFEISRIGYRAVFHPAGVGMRIVTLQVPSGQVDMPCVGVCPRLIHAGVTGKLAGAAARRSTGWTP